jgi:hypothetical protein
MGSSLFSRGYFISFVRFSRSANGMEEISLCGALLAL